MKHRLVLVVCLFTILSGLGVTWKITQPVDTTRMVSKEKERESGFQQVGIPTNDTKALWGGMP